MNGKEEIFEKFIPEHVRNLPPYNAGLSESQILDQTNAERIVKLSSNENPFEPSESVLSACSSVAITRYPDTQCSYLREQLANLHGVDPEKLVFGNGSEELIHIVSRVVLNPGDRVVTVRPSFPLHGIYASAAGADVTYVDFDSNLNFDFEALRVEVKKGCRLVALSTPSNPVGATLSLDQIAMLCSELPDDAVLLLDLAYQEFIEDHDYDNLLSVLDKSGCLFVMLRTFSKAYGLAGLRIGYGIVSHRLLADYINKVKTPFNINIVAMSAASAALTDSARVDRLVTYIIKERNRVASVLKELKYTVAGSEGNFLFVQVKADSRSIANWLITRGVIVKPWLEQGYTEFIRVSIGTKDENDLFLEAMSELNLESF